LSEGSWDRVAWSGNKIKGEASEMKNKARVLVIIEDGVVQGVVSPDGAEVFVLDADGLGNGDGLQCGLQGTQKINDALVEYRDRVKGFVEEYEYDATEDIEILDDLQKRFSNKTVQCGCGRKIVFNEQTGEWKGDLGGIVYAPDGIEKCPFCGGEVTVGTE